MNIFPIPITHISKQHSAPERDTIQHHVQLGRNK